MATNQACVMLVEADVLVRFPLAEYLRECGYMVLEAANGAEARELFASGKFEIDIVLADAAATEESGFVLASWIRDHDPQVEVILAGTVAKATEKAADLCEQGPDVAKPYDHKLVLDRIRRMRAARHRSQQTGS